MKSIANWIALLLLLPISLSAQEGLSPGQKAFRLSLIWPSAQAEFHLGSNITLEGFSTIQSLRSGASGTKISVAGAVSLNYYYNANKRTANNRTTRLFSGNAISLRHTLTLYNGDRFTLPNGDEIAYRTSSYTLEHIFRRPIGKIGFWDLGLGGGIMYRPDFSKIELIPSFRLGVGLGF